MDVGRAEYDVGVSITITCRFIGLDDGVKDCKSVAVDDVEEVDA